MAATAPRTFLGLARGSDCVLAARVLDDAAGLVADGQVAVTAVQQHNLHLAAGVRDTFRRGAGMLHSGRARHTIAAGGGQNDASAATCLRSYPMACFPPCITQPLFPLLRPAGCLCRRQESLWSWLSWSLRSVC